MAVWGGLTNSCEKKRSESQGEKERYKHLTAESQRIARRDKKAFHSDQCKEIEDNNRIGKTRDLFKKIRNTKGTFHAKMGSIKDRNGMGLTKAEASLVAQRLKHLPAMQETWVWSLGQEDPLEKAMAPHLVLLPGKSNRQRGLVEYRPWDHKESDTNEEHHFTLGWD